MPSKGSTNARGYDYQHKCERKRWMPRVKAGEVNCARCGRPINPHEPWDLGHDDYDRSRHVGPEHVACNRATSGRRQRRSQSRASGPRAPALGFFD